MSFAPGLKQSLYVLARLRPFLPSLLSVALDQCLDNVLNIFSFPYYYLISHSQSDLYIDFIPVLPVSYTFAL